MELNFWKEYFFNFCEHNVPTFLVNNYYLIVFSIATFGSVVLFIKFFQRRKIRKKLRKKCEEVDNRKIGLLQKFKGMGKPFENISKICGLSGKEIHSKIKSGELIAVDILEAFQANSLMKSSELNFLADIIYEADVSSLMINRDSKSDINGFPLSVSDGLCIERYDSTFGLLKGAFNPAKKDCVVVQTLRESGAIPSIITSTGQGNIRMSTGNPFSGCALYPFNHNLSCGGNSGSPAISLQTRSSMIAIATDICGEIRIPASFCGIVGLKPTSKRISQRFTKSVGFRQNIIENSIGTMATNVEDVISLFKSILIGRMFKLDPLCPPITFNEELFSSTKPLKIGYYINIGGNHPNSIPAVSRAVLMAKTALEKAGHELVEYKLPNVDKVFNLVYSMIMMSDGGQSVIRDILKNEPVHSSLKSYVCMLKLPNFFKKILASFVGLFCRPGGNWISGLAGTSSVYKLWKLKDVIESYKQEVLESLEDQNIDALICPVAPIVAPDLEHSECIINENIYSIIYNILDFPAGSVPVTQVNETDISNLLKMNSSKSCHIKCEKQSYSLGLPVGVQCVSLPWREEIILRIMKNISDNK